MFRLLLGLPLLATCLAGCDRSPSTSTATPVALHFKVDGMTCGGCAKSIESEVADLPGVTECKASHETGSLTVRTIDPSIEPKVIAAVSEMEFTIERAAITDAVEMAPGEAASPAGETAQPATSDR